MKALRLYMLALLLSVVCASNAQINLTNGLLLYYPFTGNATDVSGNGNVATVNGPVLAPDRFGTPNSCYFFDGINDYISIVNGANMKPTYPFSFSCWFNPVSSNLASSVNFIYCNDYTIPGDDYYGAIFNTPIDRFQASVGDGQYVDPQNRNSKMITQTLVYGQWHHLAAVVYSATNMRLFIDCAEVPGAYSGTGSGLTYSPNNTAIMGRGNGGVGENYLNAYVDEVRFYNRALNDQEIGALYYWPVYPPALVYQLPTDSLVIQCGSTVNIDGTSQGILTYSWDDNTTGPTKTFTTAGTYILTVDDGCFTGKDTLVVTAAGGAPNVTVTGPATACTGSNVTLTASGGSNYTWSPSTGLNTTTGPVVTASIADTATYTVIMNGTCGNDTANITINAVNPIVPGYAYIVDECSGIASTVNTGPATGSYLWVWDNGDTTSAYSPQIDFLNAGDHDVMLITNPGTSCADTLQRIITTSAAEKESVYIPNSFTPNADGRNDRFVIFTAQTCLDGEVYIFNSWGEKIYYTDHAFTNFWDGTYKDNKVPLGVYVYRLVLNTGKEYLGKIVLVR